MLDGDHYKTSELVDQLITNAQMKHTLDLIESLKPDLSIVDTHQGGKAYCYDYKGIIVSGGDTIHQAMLDFHRRYYSQKAGGGI